MGPVSICVEVQRNTDGDTPANPTSLFQNVQRVMSYMYLSIYLPIRLKPQGGQRTGSGEPTAGGYCRKFSRDLYFADFWFTNNL